MTYRNTHDWKNSCEVLPPIGLPTKTLNAKTFRPKIAKTMHASGPVEAGPQRAPGDFRLTSAALAFLGRQARLEGGQAGGHGAVVRAAGGAVPARRRGRCRHVVRPWLLI